MPELLIRWVAALIGVHSDSEHSLTPARSPSQSAPRRVLWRPESAPVMRGMVAPISPGPAAPLAGMGASQRGSTGSGGAGAGAGVGVGIGFPHQRPPAPRRLLDEHDLDMARVQLVTLPAAILAGAAAIPQADKTLSAMAAMVRSGRVCVCVCVCVCVQAVILTMTRLWQLCVLCDRAPSWKSAAQMLSERDCVHTLCAMDPATITVRELARAMVVSTQ